MRISDWSSDVCSSDLPAVARGCVGHDRHRHPRTGRARRRAERRGGTGHPVASPPPRVRRASPARLRAGDGLMATALRWLLAGSQALVSLTALIGGTVPIASAANPGLQSSWAPPLDYLAGKSVG